MTNYEAGYAAGIAKGAEAVTVLRDRIATLKQELERALSPAGWVLVPREPTAGMVQAAHEARIFLNMTDAGWASAYRVMIAAAPQRAEQPKCPACLGAGVINCGEFRQQPCPSCSAAPQEPQG